MTIVIVGTVALALLHDPGGTAKLVATASSVRGITWISKKVIEQISLDASQIIDFTGWSIAGVSIVKIIGNAMGSVNRVNEVFMNIGITFDKFAALIDKIIFWN